MRKNRGQQFLRAPISPKAVRPTVLTRRTGLFRGLGTLRRALFVDAGIERADHIRARRVVYSSRGASDKFFVEHFWEAIFFAFFAFSMSAVRHAD
jgi:hypothetical protein